MGMDYYISPDRETSCEDDFPSGLSYFFEALRGYDEKSAVAQVEELLSIDLSTFQEYSYDTWNDEDGEGEVIKWKDLNAFQQKVQEFLQKIQDNPNYYKAIKYNPVQPPMLLFLLTFTKEEREAQLKAEQEYESHPMYGYPHDDGYLSTQQIIADLEALNTLLACYRKAGVEEIHLKYG